MKREECEWWRLNQKKGATYTIEFTFDDGGWVRAKLDSISTWDYRKCKESKYALSMGDQMINQQARYRKKR